MTQSSSIFESLSGTESTWLVTGAAGFIGSHLIEVLLKLNQSVTGLDNFATGRTDNLDEVKRSVSAVQWQRFTALHGDIRDSKTCRRACEGADYVLHQAALGSVPRSVSDPFASHDSNVSGFINIALAARDAHVKRFVYASSSSVYGDHPDLPKHEDRIGKPLSPYAATKYMNELYADVFAKVYDLQCVGLRYFNVFGPRQDPNGQYAAVIPRWISAMIRNQPVTVFGDGETSRDFCYVDNAVQANLLAATTTNPAAVNRVYNVALGERTTLNQLLALLRERLLPHYPHLKSFAPEYREFRPGDVRHSEADITNARKFLGYTPTHRIGEGLDTAMGWYRQHLS